MKLYEYVFDGKKVNIKVVEHEVIEKEKIYIFEKGDYNELYFRRFNKENVDSVFISFGKEVIFSKEKNIEKAKELFVESNIAHLRNYEKQVAEQKEIVKKLLTDVEVIYE